MISWSPIDEEFWQQYIVTFTLWRWEKGDNCYQFQRYMKYANNADDADDADDNTDADDDDDVGDFDSN